MPLRNEIVTQLASLRAFARTLTNGDIALADDLVQDTVVNALQHHDQFVDGTNLKAWLFTILRNRFRSLISRKHVTAEVGDMALEELSVVEPTQEIGLEVDLFKRAFRRLPVSQREVLVLVAVHGLPYERVAEVCGCEVGTVKSRVSRARQQLRDMLLGNTPWPAPRRGQAGRARPVSLVERGELATAAGDGARHQRVGPVAPGERS